MLHSSKMSYVLLEVPAELQMDLQTFDLYTILVHCSKRLVSVRNYMISLDALDALGELVA